MQKGDIRTIVVKKQEGGSFLKSIEAEWLRYMGFTEKDLEKDEITLVVKADFAEHKKIPFIGIGKPVSK